MKEIETLVEEKTKDTSDFTMVIKQGEEPENTVVNYICEGQGFCCSFLTLIMLNLETDNPPPPPTGKLFDDITVTMASAALNGSQRVVMDGVITDDECRELHRLSNVGA